MLESGLRSEGTEMKGGSRAAACISMSSLLAQYSVFISRCFFSRAFLWRSCRLLVPCSIRGKKDRDLFRQGQMDLPFGIVERSSYCVTFAQVAAHDGGL